MERKPMRRGQKAKRKLLARSNAKHREWRRVRAEVMERDGGRCQARCSPDCTYRAEHAHHVILRARGGTDDAWNLMGVCFACHDHIHRNPAQATARGFMASANRNG